MIISYWKIIITIVILFYTEQSTNFIKVEWMRGLGNFGNHGDVIQYPSQHLYPQPSLVYDLACLSSHSHKTTNYKEPAWNLYSWLSYLCKLCIIVTLIPEEKFTLIIFFLDTERYSLKISVFKKITIWSFFMFIYENIQ